GAPGRAGVRRRALRGRLGAAGRRARDAVRTRSRPGAGVAASRPVGARRHRMDGRGGSRPRGRDPGLPLRRPRGRAARPGGAARHRRRPLAGGPSGDLSPRPAHPRAHPARGRDPLVPAVGLAPAVSRARLSPRGPKRSPWPWLRYGLGRLLQVTGLLVTLVAATAFFGTSSTVAMLRM